MRFQNWKQPKIEHMKMTQWGWLVAHPESLKMGERTDLGAFVYINAYYGVEIGDDVQIGGGCKIYSVDTISGKNGKIILEAGCRIGANSVVMGGVTIGKKSIVGALSFVNQDIPAGEFWGGVPAKKIK
jgi:acetyltransferase-like isoleucine patch superfamily enzyme